MTEIRKILWFSRHELTPEQREELEQLGELVVDPAAIGLATFTIRDEKDLEDVTDQLIGLLGHHSCDTIAGVIPVPLRTCLQGVNWIESWAVSRYPDAFRHYKFVMTHMRRLFTFEELKRKEEIFWAKGSNDIVLPK